MGIRLLKRLMKENMKNFLGMVMTVITLLYLLTTSIAVAGMDEAKKAAGAQLNLGVMPTDGSGGVQEYKEAAHLYRLAAARGDANGQYEGDKRDATLIPWTVRTSALGAPATVESVPNPRLINGSHVSDPDDLIDADATAQINRLLISLEHNTGVQVAVVAVDSIGKEDVFSFAQALFERWRIGDQKRDDGLLVLLVKDQNTIRMHTGYGLEGSLPDVVCKRIQHKYMVPAFKEGRYGDGLLSGLNAVASILANPAYAQALVTAPPADDSWPVFKLFSSIFGFAGLFFFLIFKAMDGSFSAETARKNGIPVSMHWRVTPWLMTFGAGPVLVVAVIDFIRPASPIIVSCIALYSYFMLVAGFQAWRQHRAIQRMLKKGEYFKSHMLTSSQQSFWFWIALLFPVPFLPHYLFLLYRKAFFRKYPRNCSECKAPMRRLNEEEEDDYLSKAQQMEETLQSADHDLWRCNACNTTLRVTYPGESTYTKCPDCKTLAYYEESFKTLVEPTRTQHGKGETAYACKFCGHKKTKTCNLAKLVDHSSSSSSSVSSSSSSSGSNRGGSSGGGGASSSW